MIRILWILILVAFGAYAWYYKQGKINDRDKDYIPDEIEDAVNYILEKNKHV